jgi:GAF domain-containing protein
MYNAPDGYVEAQSREGITQPHPLGALAYVIATKRFAQITDLSEHPAYKDRFAPYVYFVEKVGARTLLTVPLLKQNEVIGVFVIYRQEVRPLRKSTPSWQRTSPRKPSSPSRTRSC